VGTVQYEVCLAFAASITSQGYWDRRCQRLRDVPRRRASLVSRDDQLLEFKPDATPEILERIVTDIDTIVRSVRFSGWQTSQPGDREVRKQLRLILKRYGLPMTGPLFDRAYAYVAQHY